MSIINDQLWKVVPGFPCYEAHPEGLIRNAITGKILNFSLDNGGEDHYNRYNKCNMKDANGYYKTCVVHRIIAITFIDRPAVANEFNWQVDHINHCTTDNDVRNLRWLPAKLNNVLRTNVRPEIVRRKILDYYREHDIDYDYFNLLSEI